MNAIWKILNVLLILVGLVLLYLYFIKPENNSYDDSKKSSKTNTVTIAWIGPLTGSASAFGIDSLKAAELAIVEYQLTKDKDDPEIRLVVGDDSYNAEKTQHEFDKIMNFDHPKALIMLTYSGMQPIAEKALNNSVIVINSLDNDLNLAGLNRNVFLIAKETEEAAGVYADSLIQQNKKNIVIIYNPKDGFMKLFANTLSQILTSSNVKNSMFDYDYANPKFDEILRKAKSDQADAYVFFGHNEIAPALKLAREMGIDANFYAGSVVPDPEFQEIAKDAANGIYFVYFGPTEGNKLKAEEFLRSFKQKNRRFPIIEWPAMQSYDAATILIWAIKQAHAQEGNFDDNLRNNLLHLSNYQGVSGTLTIQQNGAVRGIHPALYRLEDGKPIKVHSKTE